MMGINNKVVLTLLILGIIWIIPFQSNVLYFTIYLVLILINGYLIIKNPQRLFIKTYIRQIKRILIILGITTLIISSAQIQISLLSEIIETHHQKELTANNFPNGHMVIDKSFDPFSMQLSSLSMIEAEFLPINRNYQLTDGSYAISSKPYSYFEASISIDNDTKPGTLSITGNILVSDYESVNQIIGDSPVIFNFHDNETVQPQYLSHNILDHFNLTSIGFENMEDISFPYEIISFETAKEKIDYINSLQLPKMVNKENLIIMSTSQFNQYFGLNRPMDYFSAINIRHISWITETSVIDESIINELTQSLETQRLVISENHLLQKIKEQNEIFDKFTSLMEIYRVLLILLGFVLFTFYLKDYNMKQNEFIKNIEDRSGKNVSYLKKLLISFENTTVLTLSFVINISYLILSQFLNISNYTFRDQTLITIVLLFLVHYKRNSQREEESSIGLKIIFLTMSILTILFYFPNYIAFIADSNTIKPVLSNSLTILFVLLVSLYSDKIVIFFAQTLQTLKIGKNRQVNNTLKKMRYYSRIYSNGIIITFIIALLFTNLYCSNYWIESVAESSRLENGGDIMVSGLENQGWDKREEIKNNDVLDLYIEYTLLEFEEYNEILDNKPIIIRVLGINFDSIEKLVSYYGIEDFAKIALIKDKSNGLLIGKSDRSHFDRPYIKATNPKSIGQNLFLYNITIQDTISRIFGSVLFDEEDFNNEYFNILVSQESILEFIGKDRFPYVKAISTTILDSYDKRVLVDLMYETFKFNPDVEYQISTTYEELRSNIFYPLSLITKVLTILLIIFASVFFIIYYFEKRNLVMKQIKSSLYNVQHIQNLIGFAGKINLIAMSILQTLIFVTSTNLIFNIINLATIEISISQIYSFSIFSPSLTLIITLIILFFELLTIEFWLYYRISKNSILIMEALK